MCSCLIAKRASDVMTQTNKLEWRMILKISLRAKAGVPKTLVKRKLRLHSLYFPQNSLTLTESSGEFSDLHSIFRLRALCYSVQIIKKKYFKNFLANERAFRRVPCKIVFKYRKTGSLNKINKEAFSS